MAEGTRISQLFDSVHHLQEVTTKLTDEQSRHGLLMEGIPLCEVNGGIQARSLRLDFPRFDGGDPSEWILKAQQFFSYFGTPENQKMELASFHMEGKALTWYYWLKDSSPVASWEEFLEMLRIRFGPTAFEDPVGAFTKLFEWFEG